MSVLIKNMEIPEHCGYCRFRYDGICHALQKTQYSVEECPLVSVNDINASPTIEPPQWFPTTELLPKNDDWVVVTVLDESGDTPYRYTDFGWYLRAADCWIVGSEQRNDVIAWMPLPSPYRKGGAEMKGEEDE